MRKPEKKILILAAGRSNLKAAQRLRDKLCEDINRVIIVSDQNISNNDPSRIKTLKNYQDAEVEYSEILRNAHNLIFSLSEMRINSQLTFKDLVLYQGVSLWEMSIAYSLSELIPFFRNFHLVHKIVDFETPKEVIILGNCERLGGLFRTVCLSKKIPVHLYKSGILHESTIKKYILNMGYLFRKIWRFVKSIYFRLLNYLNFQARNRSIIFFNYVERNLGVILPVIQRYNPNEYLVVNMPFSGCERRLKEENILYKYFYGYKLYSVFNQKINKFLDKIWEVVNKDVSFQDKLSYEGIMLWPALKDTFWYLIFRIFPEKIRNVDIMREIISSCKAKAIVVVNYAGDVALPARALSIPAISILPSSSLDQSYYGGAVSNYIMATGNYWKRELIEKLGAKAEQVFVTGPTKFDLVFNTEFHRDSILKELKLDSAKKTIMYATIYPCDSMGGVSYDDYLHEIRMLFRSLRNIKDVNLIIKLHPYESNFSIYRKIAKEENCEKMSIIRDFDVWKLMHCCDVLVNNSSTLSYDAVIMNKVAILLCRATKNQAEDMWNLQRYQAALSINNFTELEGMINKALYDSEIQLMLKEGRRRYIREYAWPLDGKASYRVKELIDKISLENTKDN